MLTASMGGISATVNLVHDKHLTYRKCKDCSLNFYLSCQVYTTTIFILDNTTEIQ